MGARVAALTDILDTMADKVRTAVNGIDWDIQVEPWLVINPTPLTVDMFPAEPPTDDTLTGFGDLEVGRLFTVRARTNTPDVDAARDAILALMDIEDAHSVVVALTDDQTLAGLATQVVVQGGTGLSVFPTPDGLGGYLGVQWTVLVIDIPGATPTPQEDDDVILMSSTTLTAAELLDLHNTPVELLPAPGGRFYYVVHGFVLHLRFVTTPYTYTTGDIINAMVITFGDTTTPSSTDGYIYPLAIVGGPVSPPTLFTKTEDAYVLQNLEKANLVSYGWTAAVMEDKGLFLCIDSTVPSAVLTLGDSTLTIRLFYSLIDGAPA